MGRGVLLWLLGVPLPIIILLVLFWHIKELATDEGSDRSRPPLRSFDDAVRIGNKSLPPNCTLATYAQ